MVLDESAVDESAVDDSAVDDSAVDGRVAPGGRTAEGPWPFIVAVEGIDRAGKTTQTDRLRAALVEAGSRVATLSFPRYESFFGRTIRELLDGHGAASAATVDARSMSLWYALDRWDAFRNLDRDVDVVLLNRYTLSNAVYQSSRVPAEQADALFRWVIELEFGQLRLPEPDLTVVLDVDPELSRDRSHGSAGDGRDEAPDVYERSLGLLDNARRRYLRAGELIANVVVVDGLGPDGLLASPEAIHRRVLDAVQARLQR